MPRKKPAGGRKLVPRPNDAEMAVYNLLVTSKPTREESRMTVRLLLRRASSNLGRRGGAGG